MRSSFAAFLSSLVGNFQYPLAEAHKGKPIKMTA
jgi:hypothetical protein